MITVLPFTEHVYELIRRHTLQKKVEKQTKLITQNLRHPSLHVELLEPKSHGLYSFRIDRKYRAIFILRVDQQAIQIVDITVHYQ